MASASLTAWRSAALDAASISVRFFKDAFGSVLTFPKLAEAGVHLVVAAGNAASLAEDFSPARVPSAITVGATAIDDAETWFSNYGPAVDIFAPGEDVVSTGNSPNASDARSGTSMVNCKVPG